MNTLCYNKLTCEKNMQQVIDKYLSEMGHFTDEELFEPGNKLQIKIPYISSGKQINLCPFIIPYYSKKSYLAVGLKTLFMSGFGREDVDRKMDDLISNIRYGEPGRIGEMGWEAEYVIDPKEFTSTERSRILVSGFKRFKKLILKGEWLEGLHAQPGDIIISHPLGIKFDQGFNPESEKEGTYQRSILSKKVFKFGEVKSDGMQYAIFGEDMNMHPI